MGKFKENNGKTRVGKFIQEFAPHLIDVVGEVLPSSGALGIVKNLIEKDNILSDEQKVKALELIKIDLDNVKSARAMQIAALSQDDKFSKRFIYYLASFWSLSGVAYIFATTFFTIINIKTADTTLGFLLGTIVSTIINFFFGSSQGSRNKDK